MKRTIQQIWSLFEIIALWQQDYFDVFLCKYTTVEVIESLTARLEMSQTPSCSDPALVAKQRRPIMVLFIIFQFSWLNVSSGAKKKFTLVVGSPLNINPRIQFLKFNLNHILYSMQHFLIKLQPSGKIYLLAKAIFTHFEPFVSVHFKPSRYVCRLYFGHFITDK